MTVPAKGTAKPSMRSPGMPSATMASTSRWASRSTRGRRSSTRRMVKTRESSRRSRVWSGGSMPRMLVWMGRGVSRDSSWAAAAARLNRGSPRMVFMSACRVTSQASSP